MVQMKTFTILFWGGLLLGQTRASLLNGSTKCNLTETDNQSQEQFLETLTDPTCYDRYARPETDQPLPIYIKLEISHVEAINQAQFERHLLIQYRYTDDRLNYEKIAPKRGSLRGETRVRNLLWVPHIIIKNEKQTTVVGSDGADIFLTISPKGEVIYTRRLITTSFCWMDLKKFPFDTQSCALRLVCWDYDSSDLELFWDEPDPIILEDLKLPEFSITDYTIRKATVKSTFINNALTGNFSELVLEFNLTREVGYYLMSYFIPSALLVVTSWVTFWLQADAGPPRATLGTSTMLAFITLNTGLTKNLPKVSYVMASDVWFLGCSIFIFLSLAEFAFVNVIWRRRKTVELKKPCTKHIIKGAFTPALARRDLRRAESVLSLQNSDSNNIKNEKMGSFRSLSTIPTDLLRYDSQISDTMSTASTTVQIEPDGGASPTVQKPMWYSMTPQEVAIWVDRKSRIVFPICFIIFTIFYWTFVTIL